MRRWTSIWPDRPDRRRAAVLGAVAALHLGLIALLLQSTVPLPEPQPAALIAVDVPPPPAPDIDGGGAVPDAEPLPAPVPVEIPAPVIPVPPVPAVTATGAAPLPTTPPDSAVGAEPGPGTGTGPGAGIGSGAGSGRTRARWQNGRIDRRDYPRSAARAGIGGSVTVHFDVAPDGRAVGCIVVKSSGNAELDRTTCTLVEARFRYTPARDRAGNPVPDVAGWRQDWWLEPRR